MKRTCLLTTLAVSAVIAILASDALARYRMYNSATGTFMQRDPAGTPLVPRNLSGSQFTQRDPIMQYQDGPNLYQYAGSGPIGRVDPYGLAFKVTCKGVEIGELDFPTFNAVKEASGGGVDISGGFIRKAGVDYKTGKCCCKELRWVQVVETHLPVLSDRSTVWDPKKTPYVDPRPDDDTDPFYWNSDTGTNPAYDVHNFRDVGVYELMFTDSPRIPWSMLEPGRRSSAFWGAQLCLVCVRSRDAGGGGHIEKLKCVGYGFGMTRYVRDDSSKTGVREEKSVRKAGISDRGTGTSRFDPAMRGYGHNWVFDN